MKTLAPPTLKKTQVLALKQKLKINEGKITDILNQFVFEDKCSHQENTTRLINQLEQKIFSEGHLLGLKLYISHDYNVPIEINFKPLIFTQLKQLFDEWLALTEQQNSAPNQSLYSVNFRSPLMKRIIFQQKTTIDEYFAALSKTQNITQLKGFDLYQLLVSILSPYYLYQYNEDTQIFFDKMNAFDSFMKIVNQFINHDRRIPVYDPNTLQVPALNQYIKRFQFQKLIQFWEQTNSELSIYEQQRKNKKSVQIQTSQVSSLQVSTQTQKLTGLNPINLINNAIKDINQLFQHQVNHQILESLDRMFTCFKKQKIVILAINQQLHNNSSKFRNPIISQQCISSRNNKFDSKKVHWESLQTQITPQTPPPIKKFKLQKQYNADQTLKDTFSRSNWQLKQQKSKILTKKSSQNNYLSNINLIYDFYCQQAEYLDLQQLNNFFLDLGLVEQGQTHLIFNILQNSLIREEEIVTRQQFTNIIKILAKEQKRLTPVAITKFLIRIKVPEKLSFQKDLIRNISSKYKVTLNEQHRARQSKKKYVKILGEKLTKDLSLNKNGKSKKKLTRKRFTHMQP